MCSRFLWVIIVSVVGYDGNMSKGRSTFSAVEVSDWRPIIPGSIDNALWNAACVKR